jgi:hypothetical protein
MMIQKDADNWACMAAWLHPWHQVVQGSAVEDGVPGPNDCNLQHNHDLKLTMWQQLRA